MQKEEPGMPEGRDLSTPEGSEIFVDVTLSKLRRLFTASDGQWAPLAVMLARIDPTDNPPEKLFPPKVMTLPKPEKLDFSVFMGIVSASAVSWKAASLIFIIDGYLMNIDGKQACSWCACHKTQSGKRALFCHYEHETLPRRAWYAEIADDNTLGPWEPMPYPSNLSIAFERTN